ncbi:MAG: hypothetical protein U1E93_12710 [Alphaproteobacteria bacterium]
MDTYEIFAERTRVRSGEGAASTIWSSAGRARLQVSIERAVDWCPSWRMIAYRQLAPIHRLDDIEFRAPHPVYHASGDSHIVDQPGLADLGRGQDASRSVQH